MRKNRRNRSAIIGVEQIESRCLLSAIPQFSVKDIVILPTGAGTGMNSNGQIWKLNVLTGPNGTTPFSTFQDIYISSVNSIGQITGKSITTGHAIVTGPGGTSPIDIGTLGDQYSAGSAINDSGQVTGTSFTNGSKTSHAFFYSNGTMRDLGTLFGNFNSGISINSSGQVTGNAGNYGGSTHAFLTDPNGGQMHDLGTLIGPSGSYSIGNSVNSSGQVAGDSISSSGQTHAFLSDPNGGTLHDLGTLIGTHGSHARRVNSYGQVVGYANEALENHAWLYTGGSMYDLNDIVHIQPGMLIDDAFAINDRGQILAEAYDSSGYYHSLLLTPAQQAPTVTWEHPAPITYGTPLGSDQLDATASVPGTFSYTLADGKTPASGTVLHAGAAQAITVTFTPTDPVDYAPVTQTTTLDVLKAPMTVGANNASVAYNQPIPNLTGTVTGLVNGDSNAFIFTTPAVQGSNLGQYTISPTPPAKPGLDYNDYAISFQTGVLTIYNPTIAGLTLNSYGDLQITSQHLMDSGNVVSVTPASDGWINVTENGVSAEFAASSVKYIHYYGSLGGHDWFTNSTSTTAYVYAQMWGSGNVFVDSSQGSGATDYVTFGGGYNTLIDTGPGRVYLLTNGRRATDLLVGSNITVVN